MAGECGSAGFRPLSLKLSVEVREGIPRGLFSLRSHGKVLYEKQRLEQVLCDGDTVEVFLCLAGGSEPAAQDLKGSGERQVGQKAKRKPSSKKKEKEAGTVQQDLKRRMNDEESGKNSQTPAQSPPEAQGEKSPGAEAKAAEGQAVRQRCCECAEEKCCYTGRSCTCKGNNKPCTDCLPADRCTNRKPVKKTDAKKDKDKDKDIDKGKEKDKREEITEVEALRRELAKIVKRLVAVEQELKHQKEVNVQIEKELKIMSRKVETETMNIVRVEQKIDSSVRDSKLMQEYDMRRRRDTEETKGKRGDSEKTNEKEEKEEKGEKEEREKKKEKETERGKEKEKQRKAGIPNEKSYPPSQQKSSYYKDLNETRKRTLILKGLKEPSEDFVRGFLQSNQIISGDGEIQEMQIRKIRDQSWVFLRFATEEARVNSWKKRWNIKEKKIYLHKDLSPEERAKQRRYVGGGSYYPKQYGRHPNGRRPVMPDPWWSPVSPWWMTMPPQPELGGGRLWKDQWRR